MYCPYTIVAVRGGSVEGLRAFRGTESPGVNAVQLNINDVCQALDIR